MAHDPVHHVSAVRGAQRALAVLVNERIRAFGIVESQHQVLIRLAAPIAADFVNELLPVAGRAARVDQDHYVAVGGEKLKIPTVGPEIAPHSLRSAVNDELDWIFFTGVKIRRLENEALNLGLPCASEQERLERLHGYLGKDSVVEVTKLFAHPWVEQGFVIHESRTYLLRPDIRDPNTINFVWCFNRHARK